MCGITRHPLPQGDAARLSRELGLELSLDLSSFWQYLHQMPLDRALRLPSLILPTFFFLPEELRVTQFFFSKFPPVLLPVDAETAQDTREDRIQFLSIFYRWWLEVSYLCQYSVVRKTQIPKSTAAPVAELCAFLCLCILAIKWKPYQCCLSIKQGNNCKALSIELGTQ